MKLQFLVAVAVINWQTATTTENYHDMNSNVLCATCSPDWYVPMNPVHKHARSLAFPNDHVHKRSGRRSIPIRHLPKLPLHKVPQACHKPVQRADRLRNNFLHTMTGTGILLKQVVPQILMSFSFGICFCFLTIHIFTNDQKKSLDLLPSELAIVVNGES